ncbi:MAG: hypothetical protein WCD53_16100 [Microcoleus sp.]
MRLKTAISWVALLRSDEKTAVSRTNDGVGGGVAVGVGNGVGNGAGVGAGAGRGGQLNPGIL